MRLWLVRHATPRVEAGVCYGRTDLAADPAATRAAAERLAGALPPGIGMNSSPLRRCVQLSRALCRLRDDLTCAPDARLAEMDFGTWEGQRWEALGEQAVSAWTADFARHRPGGGEALQTFMDRVGAAFDQAVQDGRDRVWITHAGVIRAAMLIAGGRRILHSAQDWPREAPDFGAWRVLDF